MLNQKHNVFKGQKSKSKIFITILCIFGLLFSWSCSCKNRVSDPNNIPLDNGIKTNKDPDPTPPPTPNNDPDKDLSNGALSTSSTKVIILANDGTTVSTTATIKFKNATGKLTKVEDSAADKAFELADLDYSGTTLTLTDSGKAKATEGEFRTIKATFSLTKSADNVDLTATEQVVDIEIGKMAKSDKASILNAISENLKKIGSVVGNQGDFSFYINRINGETIEVNEDNENQNPTTTSDIKTAFENKFNDVKAQMDKITKIEFDSVEVDTANKKKATFKYKIFLIDVYEKTFETTPLSIILTMKSTDWTDDINNPATK